MPQTISPQPNQPINPESRSDSTVEQNLVEEKLSWYKNKKIIIPSIFIIVLGLITGFIWSKIEVPDPLSESLEQNQDQQSQPLPNIPVFNTHVFENKGVIVITDKKEYTPGETAVIMIINDSDKDSLVYYPSYTIEVNTNGKWQEIQRVICQCGYKCTLQGYIILKSQQSQEFQWDQKETWCEGKKQKSKDMPIGRYRIISVVGQKDGKRKIIYSNEFEIKKEIANSKDSTET